MAAVLWPRSGALELDNNGRPAIGALASFYDAGTSTPRAVYQDAALTTPYSAAVPTDGYGRWPSVYLQFGDFKQAITTAGGFPLSVIDGIANPAPLNNEVQIDAASVLNTGDVFFSVGNATRTGAVRLNGKSLGNATSSATEYAAGDALNLFIFIYSILSDAAAPVSGGRTGSAANDFAAGKRITLPDFRGASIAGFADMGNGSVNYLDAAPIVIGNAVTPGSILGGNTQTLGIGNLPVITPSGTVSSFTPSGSVSSFTPSGTISSFTPSGTVSKPNITVATNGTVWGNTGSSAQQAAGAAFNATAVTITASLDNAPTFTGNLVTPTFTGNGVFPTFSGNLVSPTFTGTPFGSNAAHNILQRSALVTFYMKL